MRVWGLASTGPEGCRSSRLAHYPPAYLRFSVNGSITPRRNRLTCPVLEDTTIEMQSAVTLIAAAAAWRLPSPLGRA